MRMFRNRLSPLLTIYVVSFFFTLHAALPAYVNSTFLATLVPEKFIGVIFTIASLLSIIALIIIPKVLRSIGDYFVTVFFIVFEIAALIGIASSSQPSVVIILFIVSSVLVTLISFDFDLMVERFSKNASTGSIRGWYLTSADVAWVIAPVLAGAMLVTNEYWRMFLFSALLFLPGLIIFVRKLEQFRDPLYRTIHFKKCIGLVWKHSDLRGIFSVYFLLQFFFILMVIYTPIYLHEYIGFAWSELGIIFSIMLFPFLLLEAWLGNIADRVLGEKELLVAGFIVMAIATALLSFFTVHSVALFAGILFMTRVGAATVEVMTETYFFKKIRDGDAHLISLLRTIRPFAGMVGPLIATGLLFLIPLSQLFVVLGTILLLGVPIALSLKDTK